LSAAEHAIRHAQGPLSTEALARILALSSRTLHRRLKALTDESPKAFITRTRMEMARTLLENRMVPIKRVAQQCGYGDEGSFRRAFTQFTGMSPSAFRHRTLNRLERPA
jgi:AraC-like DNA-binding protein